MRIGPELAEFVGTFTLVFAGCGAMMVGELDVLGIGIAFGLAVGAMIYATGHVSGAHFNPAVTLAFAATNHFPWKRVAGYLIAQVAGGIFAIAALQFFVGEVGNFGATLPHIGRLESFVLEILITAILMFVIASVATDGRVVGNIAGLAIGSTVALNAAVTGPLTGASMNPARSIAPGIFAGQGIDIAIYIAGPILGALIGVFAYESIRNASKPVKGP